jgi:hypothetical protein
MRLLLVTASSDEIKEVRKTRFLRVSLKFWPRSPEVCLCESVML